MTTTGTSARTAVPVRHLRLLSTFWLPAAVLCGLTALGATSSAVLAAVGLVGRLTGGGEPGRPLTVDLVGLVGLVVGGLAAVVLGRITWRLAVDVPRDLHAWRDALDERREARRD